MRKMRNLLAKDSERAAYTDAEIAGIDRLCAEKYANMAYTVGM